MANGGGQDPRIMAQINQHLQRQLELTDQLVEKHNMLETTDSKKYTKMGLIEERARAALETTAEQLDLMKSSDIALAKQVESLERMEEMHGPLTEAQERQRSMVEEIQRLRREEPAILDQTIQKLSTKAALQNKALKDAAAEKDLIDKQAHAFGGKIANAMGFRKQQEGMLKAFMKSKNKIDFMKNAMKGFVAQVNFASIGTKIMQSSFQLLSGVFKKIMGGGGGGGKNLSGFVKMTGHASGNFHAMAKSGANLARKLKVGYEEGGKAIGELMTHMTGFMDMSRKTQGLVGAQTIKFMAFNVSAETTSQVLNNLTKNMGQSTKQAMKTQVKFFNAATKLGIPVEKMMDGFLDFMKDVPGLGKGAEKTFLRLTAAAKKIGVEMKSMLDFGKSFEIYEDSMEKAAGMNQMFGKAVIDGAALNAAALKGPEEAFKNMNEQLAAAGLNLKDMSRVEKLEFADKLGMDVGDMEKMLQGEKSLSDTQKAMSQVDKLTGSVRNFNKALKKTKPPGGGGRKDFMSMILWEYNKITGGKFFKNVKEMRKWLKAKITEASKFIACWIRKIETWFIDAATGFIKKWSGAIDTIGNFFGIKDLSKELTEFVKKGKDMGPLLIPILGIMIGLFVKMGGVIAPIVKGVWGLSKGLFAAGKGLLSFGKNFGTRMSSMASGFSSGTGVLGKLKGGWDGLMGKGDAAVDIARGRAQPVRIAEPWSWGMTRAQTTSEGGGGILDSIDGGKAGKASMFGKFAAKAKGFFSGGLKSMGSRLVKGFQAGKHGGFLGKGGARFALRGGRASNAALDMAKIGRSSMGGRVMSNIKGVGSALKHTFKGSGLRAMKAAAKSGSAANLTKYMAQFGDEAATVASTVAKSGMGGKAAQVGGKILGGAAKILGPVGMAYTAFTGVTKILDGDVTGGLKDMAVGALMMTGPAGMVAGGLWLAYDYFNELGDSTVTYTETLDKMTAKGKQLNDSYDQQVKSQQKEAAVARQALSVQAQVAKDSGVGMHLQGSQLRGMKATQAIGGVAKSGAAELLTSAKGEYGALQSDGYTLGGRKRDINSSLAAFRTEGLKKQKKFLNTLKEQQRDLKDADTDGALSTKTATDAIKRARDEARTRFAEVKVSHLKVLRATEAYKDPYGTYASKEAQNRKAMIDGANLRLKHAEELALMEAENLAKQKILLGRIKEKRAGYQKLTAKEMGLTKEKWTIESQVQLQRLTQLKAEGAASSKLFKEMGGKESLKMLKKQLGEAKLDQQMKEAVFDEYHKGSSALRKMQGSDRFGTVGLQMTDMVDSLKAIGLDATATLGKMTDEGVGDMVAGADSTKIHELGAAQFAKTHQGQMNAQTAAQQQSYLDVLKKELGPEKYAAFVQQMRMRNMSQLDQLAESTSPAHLNLFTGVDGKGLSAIAMKFKEKMGMTGNQIVEFRDKYQELYKQALTKGSKYEGWSPMKVAEQAAKDLKLDFSLAKQAVKEVATEAKKVDAKSLAEKGFKVSRRDINNIKAYQVLLTQFAATLNDSKLEESFAPFATGMERLNRVFKDKDASTGLDNASTFFFELRKLKTKHAKIIDQVTTSAEGNMKKIAEAEIAWQRLKIAIDDTEKSTAGQLFFKGGAITQNVNATTTVRLVVGGKDFGNAALEGLKTTGKITIP